MKPGMTCLWQIAPGRNDLSFEEWMKLDLKYIDTWSLFDDRSARQQCRHSHVSFTGTIGILKACVIDEIINLNQADIYLGKMIKHGFYSPVRSISEII